MQVDTKGQLNSGIKRNAKGQFALGNKPKGGRPHGAVNKDTLLKTLLEEVLQANYDKAKVMLNSMMDNKRDLKWFMQLKSTLEPKEQDGKSTRPVAIYIVRPITGADKDTGERIYIDGAQVAEGSQGGRKTV